MGKQGVSGAEVPCGHARREGKWAAMEGRGVARKGHGGRLWKGGGVARKGRGVTCCDAAGSRVLDGVAPEGDVRGARTLQLQRAAEGVGRLG